MRRRELILTTVILSGAVMVSTAAIVPAAMAAQVEDAEREVARLGREVEIAAERYNEIQAQIPPMQEQLAVAQAREADQVRYIDTLRSEMTDLAITAYKQGGLDPSLALLISEDPIALVQNGAVVEALSRNQSASLGDYTDALTQLAADQAATEAKLAEMQALEQESAAIKAGIESQLSDATTVLAQAERARAERAAAALAASRARAATVTTTTVGGAAAAPAGGGTPVGTSCADVGVTAPNARVAAVIQFACAQLGKPYQWAADGPNSYDCSGFTMAAWAQGGVSLPHSSRLQYANGAKVDRANLQPGDLVFFYSPISHVGIYLGGNTMIAAPSTGDVVKIQQMYSPYAGAVRP